MNLEIREFEQTIIKYINETVLPIEVKRLVIRDIFNQIEEEANKVLQIEIDNKESENGDN